MKTFGVIVAATGILVAGSGAAVIHYRKATYGLDSTGPQGSSLPGMKDERIA